MSNLNKRILTSFPLLIIAIYAIYNNIILVLSLFIILSKIVIPFIFAKALNPPPNLFD